MWTVLTVAALWALFFATHVGLSTQPLRAPLVARFGERGFTVLFSAVASLCFAAVVATYAALRDQGPAGLALARFEVPRLLLYGVVAAGFVLMVAALWRYPTSNYAAGREMVRQARGVDRITRHPFFVGLAMVGLAHVFLAPRLVGAVFMAGFAAVSLLGARHQDRKLLRAKGAAYGDFVARTSLVPFAAILAGRQPLVAAELPWGSFAVGAALCVAIRYAHESLFAWYGAAVIATTLGGAWLFLALSLGKLGRAPATAAVAESGRV